jgi:hypothetical protein
MQHSVRNCISACLEGWLFIVCAKSRGQCGDATAGGILQVALKVVRGEPEHRRVGD